MKLPSVTQEPIMNIDGTPDDGYALRILQAYRENCNCRWSSTNDPETEEKNTLLIYMNNLQDERAKLLDRAIRILERGTKSNEIVYCSVCGHPQYKDGPRCGHIEGEGG